MFDKFTLKQFTDISQYTVIAAEVRIKYRSTWIAVLIAISFTIIASFVLRFAFIRENKKREAAGVSAASQPSAQASVGDTPSEEKNGLEAESGATKEGLALSSLADYRDKTDKEIPSFRYVL